DVFFSDIRDRSTILGGLVLENGVTNANFYAMVEIVLILSASYTIQNEGSETIPRDTQPLLPGLYFVVSDSAIVVNDEIVLTRCMSLDTGTRVQSFRDGLRERDGGCVVTKVKNRRGNDNWSS